MGSNSRCFRQTQHSFSCKWEHGISCFKLFVKYPVDIHILVHKRYCSKSAFILLGNFVANYEANKLWLFHLIFSFIKKFKH